MSPCKMVTESNPFTGITILSIRSIAEILRKLTGDVYFFLILFHFYQNELLTKL